ncbi:hypothetical protein T492DRAFT_846496 [Pavlovales sp. CCMP2436]|nr:hypothetical protein T492DRAFT_846496 [Pavlovales sp. CCMP2436]
MMVANWSYVREPVSSPSLPPPPPTDFQRLASMRRGNLMPYTRSPKRSSCASIVPEQSLYMIQDQGNRPTSQHTTLAASDQGTQPASQRTTPAKASLRRPPAERGRAFHVALCGSTAKLYWRVMARGNELRGASLHLNVVDGVRNAGDAERVGGGGGWGHADCDERKPETGQRLQPKGDADLGRRPPVIGRVQVADREDRSVEHYRNVDRTLGRQAERLEQRGTGGQHEAVNGRLLHDTNCGRNHCARKAGESWLQARTEELAREEIRRPDVGQSELQPPQMRTGIARSKLVGDEEEVDDRAVVGLDRLPRAAGIGNGRSFWSGRSACMASPSRRSGCIVSGR